VIPRTGITTDQGLIPARRRIDSPPSGRRAGIALILHAAAGPISLATPRAYQSALTLIGIIRALPLGNLEQGLPAPIWNARHWRVMNMHNEIGPGVLAGLTGLFAGYGIRELALAYRLTALKDWSERAVPGAGGIILAGLFGAMTLRILG
jgi:hypothetical protein